MKLVWGIEQNEVRDTYLRHYYGIDNLDHITQNTNNHILCENIGMRHIFMQNEWESLQHTACTMSAAMDSLMHHGQFQRKSGWNLWSSESNCRSKC